RPPALDRHPRRRRRARPEGRHARDRNRQIDQRDDPELVKTAFGALLLVAVVLASHAAASSGAQPTVYAAASLTDVFPKIDATPKYQFGGSNALAAQITQGAPADVFASANLTLPNQ